LSNGERMNVNKGIAIRLINAVEKGGIEDPQEVKQDCKTEEKQTELGAGTVSKDLKCLNTTNIGLNNPSLAIELDNITIRDATIGQIGKKSACPASSWVLIFSLEPDKSSYQSCRCALFFQTNALDFEGVQTSFTTPLTYRSIVLDIDP